MAIGDNVQKGRDNDYPENTPDLVADSDYDPITACSNYEFMTNAYEGTGGFRSGRYLVPHTTELQMFFSRRKQMAFYKNYTMPIIRATIDPVFANDIKRQVLVNEETAPDTMYISQFVKNVTGSGVNMQRFIDKALTLAALHNLGFVVMDNVSAEKIAAVKDKKTAVSQRAFPYCFTKTMDHLHSGKLDEMSNIEWIRFYDSTEKRKKENGTYDNVKIYVYYDNTVIRKEEADDKGNFTSIKQTEHGLGVVPVIPVWYEVKESKSEDKIETDPPFYDIARINHAIFNKDSMIGSSERAQGFSIFYMQEDKPGTVVIGRHNYISLPMATTVPPGFATPSPEILARLVENNEKLREDLFRIAGQKGVDFRSTQPKSGDALEYEFIAQETILARTAARAEELENKIIELFRLYTNEKFDYVLEYPEKFRPDSEENELADLDKLLLIIPDTKPKTRNYIEKQAFLIKAKRWPEDEVKPLLVEFETVPVDTPVIQPEEEPEETPNNNGTE